MNSAFESHSSSVQTGHGQNTERGEGLGYSDFSQMSDHPIEQADWFNVNTKLRQFGYDPVILTHVNKLNNTASGFVILDEVVAHSLRITVENLLNDCERKRELMQELVTSSNQIQRDLDRVRKSHEDNVKEILALQSSLQAEQIKCEEMKKQRELELESHSQEVQKLVNANSRLQMKCKDLEKEHVLIPSHRPKKEVEGIPGEEVPEEKSEEREGKQGKVRRSVRDSAIELSAYDKKLTEMHKELENLREQVASKSKGLKSQAKERKIQKQPEGGRDGSSLDLTDEDDHIRNEDGKTESILTESMDTMSLASTMSSGVSDAGFLYKRLKATERKFKEAKKFIKELSEENGKLLAELNKRPKVKEWRKALVQNKQMKNVLLENNLSPTLDTSSQTIRKCTHVDDIDIFPIDVCRQHLKDICKRVEVTNINDIPRKLDTLEESFQANYKMEKILRNLLRTVKTHERDIADDASVCSSILEKDERVGDAQWKCLIPTIKVWRDELSQLKDLAGSVTTLSYTLLPWKQKDSAKLMRKLADQKVSVETLRQQLVDLAEECKTGPIKHRHGPPSKEDMQHVVEHFMKLFDVENLSGTFARMNDVYLKNSEMSNVLHTLKDLLSLEKNANSATIVNSVGTLAKAKHLLHVDDLDTVIKRLDQYDEFYLAFKSVITDLIEVLGVDNVDEIVPAVRALVRFP